MDIKLVSWTNYPKEVIAWAFANMHNPIPNNLEDFVKQQINKVGKKKWENIKSELLKNLSFNPHSSVLEFVNTVWYLGGVSRAFQQQLTRTREAAYCIQSLRIVNVGTFYDNFDFSVGPTVSESSTAYIRYSAMMQQIQDMYLELLDLGVKTEDARGILPLNIHSPITMSINLRRLQHLLDVRLCYLAQGEYHEVAEVMVEEIKTKMGEDFGVPFDKLCVKLNYCPMPVNCGKMPYELDERYNTEVLNYWLKG